MSKQVKRRRERKWRTKIEVKVDCDVARLIKVLGVLTLVVLVATSGHPLPV